MYEKHQFKNELISLISKYKLDSLSKLSSNELANKIAKDIDFLIKTNNFK